ncbi:MAG: hypothetical protein EBZ77_10420 [Chitinophagia bacterium]|nr:hypothetical protein [Chitinophagia bacterium]
MLALAIITIKQRNQQEHSTKQPPKAGATFASGMLLSLLNPLQVVFWLAWIAGLSGAGLICRNEIWYHLFSLASGIGAFAALWVYSLAGARLSAFFTIHKQRMHIIVGLFFFSLAVLEITTLLR